MADRRKTRVDHSERPKALSADKSENYNYALFKTELSWKHSISCLPREEQSLEL